MSSTSWVPLQSASLSRNLRRGLGGGFSHSVSGSQFRSYSSFRQLRCYQFSARRRCLLVIESHNESAQQDAGSDSHRRSACARCTATEFGAMKPFIRITRIPYEEPYHVHLILEASNGES